MTNLNSTKRPMCEHCGYPQKTCLCPWVRPIIAPINIVVLQHPTEAKHAKNTVRLLALGLKNITIFQGESADDFTTFTKTVALAEHNYSLCYPHTTSVAIETYNTQPTTAKLSDKEHTIIFIDASWRKALKMWHLNPWLHTLNSWHFANPPTNQYQIRHTTQEKSLSTLESVVYSLEFTNQFDGSSLMQLFQQMQKLCFKQF